VGRCRLTNSPVLVPQVLATNPTLHDHHGSDDHLRTTVHHSFDPLGAGEMDLQVNLASFGHWQVEKKGRAPWCHLCLV
jgi:hypothetical protein